jgi:hypothetical protein
MTRVIDCVPGSGRVIRLPGNTFRILAVVKK